MLHIDLGKLKPRDRKKKIIQVVNMLLKDNTVENSAKIYYPYPNRSQKYYRYTKSCVQHTRLSIRIQPFSNAIVLETK